MGSIMDHKIIVIAVLWLASGSVFAESGLLENAVKQAAKDSVKAAAPEAVQKVESAEQDLLDAKQVRQGVENAPEAAKQQAKEAAKQQIEATTPKETKQAVDTLNSGKEAAKGLTGKVDAKPKSTKVIKQQAKQKAAEKALDLLR